MLQWSQKLQTRGGFRAFVMRFILRGKFLILGPDGAELAVNGQKERAILAVLALTDGYVRSRSWLQDLLWSDRFPEQSSASLRRALSNIRRALGDHRDRLVSDRTSVALEAPIRIDWGTVEEGPLLAGIRVSDPAFQTWLQGVRYHRDGEVRRKPRAKGTQSGGERIAITLASPKGSEELRFVTRHLIDLLAQDLKSRGPIEVAIADDGMDEEEATGQGFIWHAEVDSVETAGQWIAGIRVFRNRPRRYLWSGRLRRSMDLDGIFADLSVTDFVGRAVTSIHAADREATGVYRNLLTAAQKVFLGDRDELELADRIFAGLEPEDRNGTTAAWRAYVGLTRLLEYGVDDPDQCDMALSFAQDAQQRGVGNALAMALAAQVTLKVGGEVERGQYLAELAARYDDRNPYALHALSQASVLRGDYLAGYKFAEDGRRASASLPHGYCWDMQTCLAALGIGRRDLAYELAHSAHLKMAHYRPALRYLAALSLLDNRHEEAETWCRKLRRLEPQFQQGMLLSESYPIDTFRKIGLQSELASVWTP